MCAFIGALGATSKLAAGIDATTRLLDDDPIGRRREPRHPLGAGERDDRDRLRRERLKREARNAKQAVQTYRKGKSNSNSSSRKETQTRNYSVGSIAPAEGSDDEDLQLSGDKDDVGPGEVLSSSKQQRRPLEAGVALEVAQKEDEEEDEEEDEKEHGRGGEAEEIIDVHAEAGGMGLVLVPLTVADMQINFPEKYRER